MRMSGWLEGATIAWFGLGLLGGCRELDRFSTGPGEAYCGTLVNAGFAHHGFVPENGPGRLKMRLTLDARKLVAPPAALTGDPDGSVSRVTSNDLAASPGRITTDDAEQGSCRPDPLFLDSPFRAVAEAQHDPISLLEFGDGREYNGLVWVDSKCLGTMLGVLSLMRSGGVELRLFKPAPLGPVDAPALELPGFAQFSLVRGGGDCEF
jgi:hypothetical protein